MFMEKVKQLDFVFITFILLGLRALAVEPGIGFALTSACFAGIVAFKRYQDAALKPDINADLQKEISEIRSHIGGLMMKHAAKPQQQPSNEVRRFF
jgi:hypothetical protein